MAEDNGNGKVESNAQAIARLSNKILTSIHPDNEQNLAYYVNEELTENANKVTQARKQNSTSQNMAVLLLAATDYLPELKEAFTMIPAKSDASFDLQSNIGLKGELVASGMGLSSSKRLFNAAKKLAYSEGRDEKHPLPIDYAAVLSAAGELNPDVHAAIGMLSESQAATLPWTERKSAEQGLGHGISLN
jgi:hypothetical protein